MAGIGFSIQKLLDRDTYLGAIEGYFLGAFVAAGPMVILIFAIGLLGAVLIPKAIGNMAKGSTVQKSLKLLVPLCGILVVLAIVLGVM